MQAHPDQYPVTVGLEQHLCFLEHLLSMQVAVVVAYTKTLEQQRVVLEETEAVVEGLDLLARQYLVQQTLEAVEGELQPLLLLPQ